MLKILSLNPSPYIFLMILSHFEPPHLTSGIVWHVLSPTKPSHQPPNLYINDADFIISILVR